MPDEQTQVSAGAEGATAAAVMDKPSPTPEAGVEKGSAAPPTPAPAAQEHRETTVQDIVAVLARMDPKTRATAIKSLDPQWVRDHPYVHQSAQSSFDRGRNKGAEETRQMLEQQRERERLKSMDELELGAEMKRRIEEEERMGPIYAQVRQQLEAQYADELGKRYTTGYQEAYRELEKATRETRTKLDISAEDWDAIVLNSPNPIEIMVKMVEQGASRQVKKALDAELAKLSQRQERESQVEQRAQEQSPDLGGGSAAGSDKAFLADFASGKNTDFARAKKLLGM